MPLVPTNRARIAQNTNIMSKTDVKTKVTIYHDTQNWSLAWEGKDANGKPIRLRKTFNLNRLHDLVHRGQRANFIALILEKYAIAEGYLSAPTRWDSLLAHSGPDWTLAEAVRYAVGLKVLASDRSRTHETFEMYGRIFIEHFLVEMDWLTKKLSDFSRRDAQTFLDWLTEGGTKRANGVAHRGERMKGQTLKNYRSGLRSLFTELEDRELVDKNPWSRTKTIAVEEAIRRPMTEQERKTVFNALYSANPFLLLGVLFQYYCAIRPGEMRRLKFRMIDLEAGLVQMPPDVTKNHNRGAVTIPSEFAEILRAYSVGTFPADWWIFGRHLKPHPSVQMGEKTLSNAHRIILQNLAASGALASIEGLQFYSWKDNCGVSLVDGAVDIDDIRIHFRHKSLDYTQRYLSKKRGVIASIRNKESGLTDADKVKERLLNWSKGKKS